MVSYDDTLTPAAKRDIVGPLGKLLAASSSLDVLVMSTDTETLVYTADEHRSVDIPAADSAVLLSDGRILVTAPEVLTTETGVPYRGQHSVALVHAATGTIENALPVESYDAGAFTMLHPSDGTVLIELGEGQDGSRLFRVRIATDRLTVDPIAEDTVAATFGANGRHLLLLPHPSYTDPGVRLVTWPDLDEVASLTTDALGWPEDAFQLYGCHLADDLIVLATYEHGVLATNGQLEDPTAVEFEGVAGEFEMMFGVGSRHLLTSHWTGGQASWNVWRL